MKFTTRLRCISRTIEQAALRLLVLFLVLLLAGCDGRVARVVHPQSPEPQAGIRTYQKPLLVNTFGGTANVAGGNLLLAQGGILVATVFGQEDLSPVYNSATNQWRFGSFDSTFDGSSFVDSTGAEHDVTAVADGAAIPGTDWIKVDGDTIMAKGGLISEFGPAGQLVQRYRDGQACPRILYEEISLATVQLQVRQQDCGTRGNSGVFNLVLYTATYDGQGNVTRIDTPDGRTAFYTYAGNQLLTAKTPEDVVQGRSGFQYEYHLVTGLLAAATNSEGERIEYEFISPFLLGTPRLQYVTRVARAGEGDLQYRFDYRNSSAGLAETVVTDTMGRIRRFAFDDLKRAVAVAWEAVGESESYTYVGDELRPDSHTLANGATESYTWDGDGNILTIDQATGNIVTHVYADANNPFPFSKALAFKGDLLGTLGIWTYTEDAPVDYKRLASWENGAGEVTRYTWHPGAEYTRLSSTVRPNGVTQEYSAYTPTGPAGQTVYGGSLSTTTTFDAAGNSTTGGSSLNLGGVRSRGYDQNRNPVGVVVIGTDELEKSIAISRGSDGRIFSIDRPPSGLGAGPDHVFSYNTLGQLVTRGEVVDGTWDMTLYEHDGEGNLTAETLSNGMRREWDYDQRARLVAFRTFRHGVAEGSAILTYVDGNLGSVDDSERGLESYLYDSAGRRILAQSVGGEAIEYEYDIRSRLIRETFRQPGPDDAIVKEILYAYDGADRQTRIHANGKLVLERTFVDGQVDCTRTGNGLERCVTYDPTFGLPSFASTTNVSSGVVAWTDVQHVPTGPSGNWEVSSVTDVAGFGVAVENYGVGPGHDPETGELPIGKRVLSWTGGAGGSQTYEYDALSNQQSDADGDLYGYNLEGNRLLTATVEGEPMTYTYDSAGFVTSRNGIPITWTAGGKMASYGDVAATWDMFGKPLTVTDNSGATTVYRDWSRWGGRIETNGAFLVSIGLGPEVVLGFEGQERYRHFDFRGNVSWISDENGDPLVLYEYSPYGVDSFIGDNGDGVNFVGKSQVGPFMLLGERMYDPLVGRFLSPDPVLNLLNQYTYTMGNPLWFSDAEGRFGIPRTAGEFVAIVGVALAGISVGISIAGFIALSPAAALGLAAVSLAVSAVGLAIAIGQIAAPTAPDNSGCGCVPTVSIGIGPPGAGPGPQGAGAPGGASGGGGNNGESGVTGSQNGAGKGAGSGAGGGMAGSSGGFVGVTGFGGGGCGLLGIEPFLAYGLLRWISFLLGSVGSVRRRRAC